VMPVVRDRDGHNAKHGYGSLSAESACLCAACPVGWALVRIGETAAAVAFQAMRSEDPEVRAAFTPELARWIVRALLADARTDHAARAIARHARLLAADPMRARDFPAGALTRQVAVLVRGLVEGGFEPMPEALKHEALRILDGLAGAPYAEQAWLRIAEHLFSRPELKGACP